MSTRFLLILSPRDSKLKDPLNSVAQIEVASDFVGKLKENSTAGPLAESFRNKTVLSVPVNDPRGELSLCLLANELSAELLLRFPPSDSTDQSSSSQLLSRSECIIAAITHSRESSVEHIIAPLR